MLGHDGAARGTRTPDMHGVNVPLYQLSYRRPQFTEPRHHFAKSMQLFERKGLYLCSRGIGLFGVNEALYQLS